MSELLVTAILAASSALALTVLGMIPGAALARRVGLVDHPGGRHAHRRPTPLVGVVPVVSAVLAIAMVAPADGAMRMALIIGAVLMLAIGVIDDRYDLSPFVKLTGQAGALLVPVVAGFGPSTLTLPVIGAVDLGPWRILAWILWGLVIVNALNLIDGHDGLATGIVIISGITLGGIAIVDGRALGAVIAAATVGAAIGFFPFNAPPARVFLGDGGALGLGYLLAMGAISSQAKTAAAISLVFPLIVLAAPILDVTNAILRRLRARTAPWRPDRGHVHHRLADAGLSPRGVLGVLLGWCAILAAYAVLVRVFPRDGNAWDPLAALVLGTLGGCILILSWYVIAARIPRWMKVWHDVRGGSRRTR